MTEIPVSSTPSLWRRVTAAYAKLLEFLLAVCVGILVIPVTLQIISRYTPFIPSYIWTEEMARFMPSGSRIRSFRKCSNGLPLILPMR